VNLHWSEWPSRNRRLDPQGYVYVVQFSLDVIKVGKTNSPRVRMKIHERDVSRYGGAITSAWLSSAHHGYGESETALIRATAEMGRQLGSVEYFKDCCFADVVDLAANIETSAKARFVPWGIPGARGWLLPDPECEEAFARIMAGWRGDHWRELGHWSWEGYCRLDLRDVRSRAWPLPKRQRLVGMLRREGLSIRGIASALGRSVGTIFSDLQDLGNDGGAASRSPGAPARPPVSRRFGAVKP